MPHLRKGKATEYWPGFDKPGQSLCSCWVNIHDLVRQSTWKFWPNLKLNDKVFFSFDYSSIGSQRTIPGGWHVATLEQFEIFKMAARYVKKYIIVLNCIQIWYIWHQ